MNNEKYRNIELFYSKDLPRIINLSSFKDELAKKFYSKRLKVFLIANPRINNIIETNIDLLLIIAIENKNGNYVKIENTHNKSMYFNNLIIPIKFIEEFEYNNITPPKLSEDNNSSYNLYIEECEEKEIFEIKNAINELKWETKHYLEKVWRKFKLEKINIEMKVNPYPIIWIISSNKQKHSFCYDNIICTHQFGLEELENHLKHAYFHSKSFTSVYSWSHKELRDNKESYLMIDKQIDSLITQLELDNKIGTLTKNKINRLHKQYCEDSNIYEKYLNEQDYSNKNETDDDIFDLVFGLTSNNIKPKKKMTLPSRIVAEKGLDKNLILIEGKAGSGKTFEMLLLMKKCYERSQQEKYNGSKLSSYYLTYNKLLAHDVRLLTNQYQKGSSQSKTRIKTIHKFLFDIAKNLSIIMAISYSRIEELKDIQFRRCEYIKEKISTYISDEINVNTLYNEITLNETEEGKIKYIYLFLSYLKKKYTQSTIPKPILLNEIDHYKNTNINKLSKDLKNNIFLQDYYQVLRYIILAIKNETDKLYDLLNIDSISKDAWNSFINEYKKTKKLYKQTKEDFKLMVQRSIQSQKSQGEILFIDEGQDCHELEKEIFLKMWDGKNIVVCSGGKEQLIRHDKECNWLSYNGNKVHNIIRIEKRNKTYRMKPNLIKLCNFLAKEYEVNLDLSSHNIDTDDLGSVIIDFKKENRNIKSIFEHLDANGKKNGNELSNYENILFLTESVSKETFMAQTKILKDTFTIDDQHNIINQAEFEIKTSRLVEHLNIDEQKFFFYHQNRQSKDEENREDEDIEVGSTYKEKGDEYPTQDQYRVIFYESCRGLEAWSAMCLDIDLFYQRKYDEDQAAIYLSDRLDLNENERREKYAITWVLMALTRAIDTIYITVDGSILKKLDGTTNSEEDELSKGKLKTLLEKFSEEY